MLTIWGACEIIEQSQVQSDGILNFQQGSCWPLMITLDGGFIASVPSRSMQWKWLIRCKVEPILGKILTICRSVFSKLDAEKYIQLFNALIYVLIRDLEVSNENHAGLYSIKILDLFKLLWKASYAWFFRHRGFSINSIRMWRISKNLVL